jgi:hypothetical protein
MGLFGNKNKKKQQFLSEIEKKVFPGGKQQKEDGAREVMRISHGKLDFRNALKIFATAKARISISSDLSDDRMIKNIIIDSGNILTYPEATDIFKFCVFGFEEPSKDNDKAMLEMLMAGFGTNNDGLDVDELPNGFGEFGHSVTNPIPVKGIVSNEKYLSKLRTQNGERITWQRERSVKSENIEHAIDVYNIFNAELNHIADLYISPYHKRISNKIPKGFISEETNVLKVKDYYPNFFNYILSKQELLKLGISRSDTIVLECKFPIITFGQVYGYNFIGIQKKNIGFNLYMNSESIKGYKIKGKEISLKEDISISEYENLINELSTYLMIETDYMKITIGDL